MTLAIKTPPAFTVNSNNLLDCVLLSGKVSNNFKSNGKDQWKAMPVGGEPTVWGRFVKVTDVGDSCLRSINIPRYSVEKVAMTAEKGLKTEWGNHLR